MGIILVFGVFFLFIKMYEYNLKFSYGIFFNKFYSLIYEKLDFYYFQVVKLWVRELDVVLVELLVLIVELLEVVEGNVRVVDLLEGELKEVVVTVSDIMD